MTKYLLILSALFLLNGCGNSNSTSNSAYGRYLDCQYDALTNFQSQNKLCKARSTYFEQSSCYSGAYKTLSTQSCMKAASISLNSISEMYKLLAFVDDPKNPQKYSQAKRSEIYSKINSLIKAEENLVSEILNQDMDRRKAAYYESRAQYYESLAQSNIYNSLAILGAQPQTNSNNAGNSPFRTYILNGKTFNCMTTGNITTCN